MNNPLPGLFAADSNTSWIRLRTLIMLRWLAIIGQIGAITLSGRWFDLDLDLGLCTVAIGLAVIVNLVAIFVYPENKRLNEREVTLFLLADTAQLALLLSFAGGLNNPFALLMVAPVTVAATALGVRAILLIGGTAIALTSLLTRFFIPFSTKAGELLELPQMFAFGQWVAIVVTILFLGLYARRISTEMQSMSQALMATQMALSREQKLTDLGGVVAAAAHELGTPLATIKLVSSELADELENQPDHAEDARLIHEQADRCRDILRNMGRAGKDDMHLRQAPLIAVVEEAAEPHRGRGKEISIRFRGEGLDPAKQPTIYRRPEIIHGLRNFIQNAVDFAASEVWVEMCWTDETMTVRVIDDGRGYSPDIIGRIGDPFISDRRPAQRAKERPEYEGMGLGLFIAKTLLQRTGAKLSFANGAAYDGQPSPGKPYGAIVQAVWKRGDKMIESSEKSPPLGENIPFHA